MSTSITLESGVDKPTNQHHVTFSDLTVGWVSRIASGL